ncbi:YbhB/YbcL family Raf kinase inhibitor-like protein [Brucella intermedia GD04153]|uniref:YbhB/YbcL family Raf kinase inhibitor-like protein n=1 Tax=Brucella intermedia GD04153 TaxID=2975438 RepID=A0AA42H2G9_9HYPH|nr:YbhB/YbcL family Raf kinase inhibitor-like protein [Brucella intermedia]MDH0127110.1 YbhB/YbcL family Raf kinase inhibitor-like protein [Brucella intermedia GD04153]RRD21396.1 YbhB/YbcL family Raf kinase inhibitor-like protein [Brucellaceae bacterium VT-16-1752]
MKHILRALTFNGALLAMGTAYATDFTVSSPGANRLLSETHFANGFGCAGDNLSPQISWKNAPKGTKSFAVSMYDPDAPTGSGWWHWVAINIPASISELPEGAGSNMDKMPAGSMMTGTDVCQSAYFGACPPKGETHRYVITVKALSVEKLDLPTDASGALAGFMTNASKLGEATITFKARR